MNKITSLYKNAFGGLSRPAWMLSIVMLINRSGTMVVPFLSIYLTSSLGFTLEQAGLILTCFGTGAMIGAFIGGTMTDRYGHFFVQVISLIGGGIMFIILSSVKSFYPLIAGIFLLSIVSESLRPANASSVASYAKPENVTRAFSLNRMAINLGFSVGPALGGFLATISYRWLFITDGMTCIAAGVFFFFYFRNRKGNRKPISPEGKLKSGYRDVLSNKRFIFFIILVSCFAILFFQLFITLPLYYRAHYHLPESKIGILLAMNGIIVFCFEMIVVYTLNKRFRINQLLFPGLLMLGLSFVLLNIFQGVYILFVAMFILSFAEIFSMPFMATFTVQQSNNHNRGSYMGLYTLSFSMATAIAPFLGTKVISSFGFETLWWGTGALSIFIGLGFLIITKIK